MTIGSNKLIQYTERMVGENSPSYDDTLNRAFAIDHEQDGHHKWVHFHENSNQTTGENEFLLLVKNDGTQTELYGRSENNATVFQITKGDKLNIENNVATQGDIDAGTDNEKIVTPLLFVNNALQVDDVTVVSNELTKTSVSDLSIELGIHDDVMNKLVTNGDSHDHSGGDGGQIAHSALGSVTEDQHHNRQHALDSSSDHTGITGSTNDFVSLDASGMLQSASLSGSDFVKVDGSQPLTSNWDVGNYSITAARFISDIATGTAPFTVSSTTKVTNLNADQLDGISSTSFFILAGQSGGQSASGGTASGDDLTLKGTAHADNNGDIILNPDGGQVLVGQSAASFPITASMEVDGSIHVAAHIYLEENYSIQQNLYYSGGWKYVGDGYGALYRPTSNTGQLQIQGTLENTSGAGAAATMFNRIFGDANNNLGLVSQTSFGTNAEKVLAIAEGTDPTTSPSDAVQLWCKNRAAGKAGLAIRSEDGTEHIISDRIGIGTVSPEELLHVRAGHAQFDATGSFAPQLRIRSYYNGGAAGAVNFGKARGGDFDSPSAVVDGDTLGGCGGQGYHNSGWRNAAYFNFEVDGTPSGNYVPGLIKFVTINDSGGTASKYFLNQGFGIGTSTIDSSATKVLAIGNGTAHTTQNANQIYIQSENTSDAKASLSLVTEQDVEAGAPTLSHKHKVTINGTEYYIGLEAV